MNAHPPIKSVGVLFLCTGNSCRSQMAEAILRKLGASRFEAFSAGSSPAGFIHPLAIQAMRRLEIPIEGQRSKKWDEFGNTEFDAIITLCDRAAAETCPVWPGQPATVHWSMADPVFHFGTENDRVELAVRVAERLMAKISGLMEINWSAPREALKQRLEFLAEI